MICGSVCLLNVRVTHPQPNQRGDPDSCRSRFEGSVVAPAVPSKGAGWSHLLLTSVETSERDTHHKNHLLQKCCTKFAHLVRGRRCGFIQASLQVMKYRHSARVAVRLEVQSSALQRAPGLLSTQSNEERAAAPAQRFVEQINLDDSTSGEKRHVQDRQAQAAAAAISRETLCAWPLLFARRYMMNRAHVGGARGAQIVIIAVRSHVISPPYDAQR